MNRSLRASTYRFAGGCGLLAASLAIANILLPDASEKKNQQEKAFRNAKGQLEAQEAELAKLKARAESLRLGRERMEDVLSNLSQESEGQLKWRLSRTLYDLAAKHGVRIQSVKYGTPTREGARGTNLEVLDVEFVCAGVYGSLKGFMLALESSKLPFGLSNAKLEESPEGARITVSLRAFRRSTTVKADQAGEEA